LYALIEHPENNPALIDNAAGEMIHWVTPIRRFLRHGQQDFTLGTTRFRSGDRVLLSHRDESVFEDPFRFDVSRANAKQHLAFGIEVHFCLGAHFA
jgi:cytochrome P450